MALFFPALASVAPVAEAAGESLDSGIGSIEADAGAQAMEVDKDCSASYESG